MGEATVAAEAALEDIPMGTITIPEAILVRRPGGATILQPIPTGMKTSV